VPHAKMGIIGVQVTKKSKTTLDRFIKSSQDKKCSVRIASGKVPGSTVPRCITQPFG
jgi:hypothetical protein